MFSYDNMNTTIILEKLRKLEDVYNFTSILKIKFAEDKELSFLLELAEKSLKQVLAHLVFDIQKRFKSQHYYRAASGNDDFDKAACYLDDFLSRKKIENVALLKSDIDEIATFLKEYKTQRIMSREKTASDLRRECLRIISERLS